MPMWIGKIPVAPIITYLLNTYYIHERKFLFVYVIKKTFKSIKFSDENTITFYDENSIA